MMRPFLFACLLLIALIVFLKPDRGLGLHAIENGKLQFLVGTVDKNGRMAIYKDGILIAEKDDGQPIVNVKRSSNFLAHSNYCKEDPDFKGILDDVRVYNYRYVGANHESDYSRLDDWLERIIKWRAEGLQSLYFFVHQNVEKESPLLSAYFIDKLNKHFDLDLKMPSLQGSNPLGL